METNQPIRVLLVEDDQQIVDFVCQGLGEAGYCVDVARSGDEGLALGLSNEHDVMIVDIMLPGIDGLEMLQRLREQQIDVPILILSARCTVNDRVTGLKVGGDDYLTKPFAFAELHARIESLLRRVRGREEPTRLRVADLTLDLIGRRVYRGEQEIELQHQEFVLLEYLMRNSGRVVTRSQILQHVWGYRFNPSTNLVDVHVCRLREKIEHTEKPKLIKTIRGAGYVLSDDGQIS